MPPAFIYFDMGNVLLNFSHHRAARQMAEVAGVSQETVWDFIFAGEDLESQCERGDLQAEELYELFCQHTNTKPEFLALERAGSDIFESNRPMIPLVCHLAAAKVRLGVLSNTSASHWKFVTSGRFGILPGPFEQFVLSHEVRVMKPDKAIYEAAIEKASVPASEIVFVDDREENIAGAIAAGIDGILYQSVDKLSTELYERGVRMNF